MTKYTIDLEVFAKSNLEIENELTQIVLKDSMLFRNLNENILTCLNIQKKKNSNKLESITLNVKNQKTDELVWLIEYFENFKKIKCVYFDIKQDENIRDFLLFIGINENRVYIDIQPANYPY
jgi:hypothetical protein